MKRIYLSLSLLLLVIIGSRAANFKFAFLTDIHITAGDSIPYNDLARSVNQSTILRALNLSLYRATSPI